MKILYGVQGNGDGHITRARHMLRSLSKNKDLNVDFLFSGRHKHAFFDMHEFSPYSCYEGVHFSTKKGHTEHFNTLLNNNWPGVISDINSLDVKQYNLVINDFEPISAWAAKRAGVPSLSISHQSAYVHGVPRKDQGLVNKLLSKYFAPTRYTLGTHWYHFGHNIIPPIVDTNLHKKSEKPKYSNSLIQPILVHLPFEKVSELQQLHVLSDANFICYHPSIKDTRKDKNIVWKSPSSGEFNRDLSSSAGVISHCDFELTTECLSLGLPMLVKPLKKQYEQVTNAYMLSTLKLCEILPSVNIEDIDDWLQTKQGVKVNFPNTCDALVDWIYQGKWHASQKLCETLWQQVSFPQQVKTRLQHFSAQ